MPICYILPGLAASSLYYEGYVPFRDGEAWVSVIDIFFGQIKGLALAPNGINPHPNGGKVAAPAGKTVPIPPWPGTSNLQGYHNDGFIPIFYSSMMRVLYEGLRGHGYVIQPYPYDWRKRIRNTGIDFANRIRKDFPANGPCAIVAHSMGGLVARYAWYALGQTGQQDMVRRIVTLGTPHQGSYATIAAACQESPIISGIVQINNFSLGLKAKEGKVLRHQLTALEVANIMLTWPSFYDLMPMLGGSEARGDPDRALLYNKGNWPAEVEISQAHLDYARDRTQPFLRSAASMPPSHVLTTVGGDTFSTRDGVVDLAVLGHPNALGFSGSTDGTVTIGSSLVDASARHQLVGKHMMLPTVVANDGSIVQMVLDERAARSDPPALELSREQAGLEYQWPPLNAQEKGGGSLCNQGMCVC